MIRDSELGRGADSMTTCIARAALQFKEWRGPPYHLPISPVMEQRLRAVI